MRSAGPDTPSFRARLHQIARFGVVGGTGFLVDAGLLALLIHGGWTPLPARVVSILVALTVTWQLNRRVTFAMSGAGSVGEFGQYLSLGAATSGFNYAIYAALIASGVTRSPFVALMAGSAAAMVVTFVGLDRVVFRKRHRTG